jgi:hypothetical protein
MKYYLFFRYVQKALVELLAVVLDVRQWENSPKGSRGKPPDTGGWNCIHKVFMIYMHE